MKSTLLKRLLPAFLLMAALACVLTAFPNGGGGGPIPAAIAAAGPAAAADEASETAPVTVRAVAQRAWVTPDGDLVIAVVLKHAERFHTWPAKPGEGEKDPLPAKVAEFAIRTSISVAEQPDWVAGVGNTQYPPTHQAKVADPSGENPTITVECYEGEAVAFIPVVVKAGAPAGVQTLKVAVAYQACNDKFCAMPEDVTIEVPVEIVTLEKAATMPAASAADAELFKSFEIQRMAELRAGKVAAPAGGAGASSGGQVIPFDVFGLKFTIDPRGAGLVLLLLTAFVGGVILNFTPCVLPVIPLKIMSLANLAGNPAKCLYLGTFMSLGVVAFWLVLGVLILTISGFTAISSLFSYPLVILGIGVFILVMGLGMFGLFTISLPQSVYMFNPKQETATGSFLFGVLTAVLATPCTAPLMGTASAWAAQTGNPALVLAVFGAIGVGMAVPYFILSINPKLVSKMPSVGPASDLVKQVMGGLMIAVSIFFLGNALIGIMPKVKLIDPLMWWGIAVAAGATALWMLLRTFRISKSGLARSVIVIVALLLVAVPTVVAMNMTRRDPIPWQEYDATALATEVGKGQVVVLDFTASWCLTCKALEQTVLRQEGVLKVLNKAGVTPIKVDVTAKSAPGWQKLKEYGAIGIPLFVVLRKDTGEVVFKSDAYTPQQVIDAVTAALK